MNLLPGTKRVTADAQIGTVGKPIRVFNVSLVSGATASTAILKNGSSTSADAYTQIDGGINLCTVANYAGGLRFPNGCFFDADANISYATVTFTEEF